MRISNIKVKTASIPSRTAACQFLAREGYDMEWAPELGLFYIHDQQKNQLHVVAMSEVTNFSLDCEPVEYMRDLRSAYASGPGKVVNKMAVAKKEALVPA